MVWLALGIALIVLELILPGLVVVFLGAAALMVAALIHLGWVEGVTAALTLWFVLSVGLVLVLRGFFVRLLPGDQVRDEAAEDADAWGESAEVVSADGLRGRIRFRGVEWDALSEEHELVDGERVVIVGRENVTWLVRPTGDAREEAVDRPSEGARS